MGDQAVSEKPTDKRDKRGEQASDASLLPGGAGPRLLQPRDATRGGVNDPAMPGQRGRESPLSINVTAAAYAEQVEDVKMFLSGKNAELLTRLRGRMAVRADQEDFEVAAVLRDSIAAVERTLAKQHIVQDDFVDQDVWGLHREADVVEVVVLFVRGGKLVGRRAFQQKD